MRAKRSGGVRSSSHAPTAPPATLGSVRRTTQARAPRSSPRYPHMLLSAPGHSATVLVALAVSAGTPSPTSAGKVSSVPPPAMAFTPPPSTEAMNTAASASAERGSFGIRGKVRPDARRRQAVPATPTLIGVSAGLGSGE